MLRTFWEEFLFLQQRRGSIVKLQGPRVGQTHLGLDVLRAFHGADSVQVVGQSDTMT